MVLKNINSMKLETKAFQDLKLDNIDINSMLNDPKISSMSLDLNNLQNSKEEMEKVGKELKSMGVDMEKKTVSNSLNDVKLTLPPSDLIKIDIKKPKSILEDNDALSQLGGLKELGIKDFEEDIEKKKEKEEKEKKKKEEEEKIKKANSKLDNIDTLTRSQAHLLLDILKQPTFFEMIPQEAQKIIKVKINFFKSFLQNKK
jgi:hypothetical protein